MKKILTLVLAALMFASLTQVVFAAGNTTTLTTTVPAAQYTLNVPADQSVDFGTTEKDLGNVTVTDSSGFAIGKNLLVAVSWTSFASTGVDTTIPFTLGLYSADQAQFLQNGDNLRFEGKSDGTVNDTAAFMANNRKYYGQYFLLRMNSADWGKALGGDYTATITFTAEVVAEN